jgi:Cdc6-like AAA superfamily ATPase
MKQTYRDDFYSNLYETERENAISLPNPKKPINRFDELFQKEVFMFKNYIHSDGIKQTIKRTIDGNYAAFANQSNKAQDWSLIALIGQSGIGKTRTSFEISKQLSSIMESTVKRNSCSTLTCRNLRQSLSRTRII